MPNRPFSREVEWLFPPTLGEMIPDDHPARYVAEFVDRLSREAWLELGVAPDGEVRGAPGYHPGVLLGVWVYGFMEGVRSSRKLEKACRDQVPYLWLTGWQRPDHNTLWRFYQGHRQAMRALLKRTVRVAVAAGLVDLAVQAVDGTRIAGSAARERTLDAAGLAALLVRTEAAITDLEAQNTGGEDPPPVTLPTELASLHALRDRIEAAQARVSLEDGATRTNLTDPEATLQKARGGGFVVGYNAQAMVAGVTAPPADGPDRPAGPGGLLITAADVTTDRDDHDQLLPLLERAAEITGAPIPTALADGGYHSAANLAACAEHTPPIAILMPDPQAPRPGQPFHKDRFVYDPATDTYTCPRGQTLTFHGLTTRQAGAPPIRK
jgi:transposase